MHDKTPEIVKALPKSGPEHGHKHNECRQTQPPTPLQGTPRTNGEMPLKQGKTHEITAGPHHRGWPQIGKKIAVKQAKKPQGQMVPFSRGHDSGREGVESSFRPEILILDFQQTRVYPYPLGAGSARPNPKMGASDPENPLFLGFSVLRGGLRPWSQHGLGRGQTMG